MPTLKDKKLQSEFAYIELSPWEIRILEKVKQSKISYRQGKFMEAREFFKKFKKEHNIK